MSKYFNIYSILGVLVLVSAMVAGLIYHNKKVYTTGYDAGYTKAQKETLALNELTIQKATAKSSSQKKKDAAFIHKQQLENIALAQTIAQLKRQEEKDDAKNPDKYPDNWRLTEFDLQLLQRFAAAINNSNGVGTYTRTTPEAAPPDNSTSGNGQVNRMPRFVQNQWHTIFRQSRPAERYYKGRAPTPTLSTLVKFNLKQYTNATSSVLKRSRMHLPPPALLFPNRAGGLHTAC